MLNKISLFNRFLWRNSAYRLASKCSKTCKKSGKSGKPKMKCPNSCAARPKKPAPCKSAAKAGAAGKGGGAGGGKKPPSTRPPLPGKKPIRAPMYRNISLAAIVGVIGLSAVVLGGHGEHERPEYVPYDHMRLHYKRFPWGDGEKSRFHNPHVNPLKDGYED